MRCPYCHKLIIHKFNGRYTRRDKKRKAEHMRRCEKRPERESYRPKVVIEGDYDDPDSPDGDIMELPNGHRFEMGVNHHCGIGGCPADISWRDSGKQ